MLILTSCRKSYVFSSALARSSTVSPRYRTVYAFGPVASLIIIILLLIIVMAQPGLHMSCTRPTSPMTV